MATKRHEKTQKSSIILSFRAFLWPSASSDFPRSGLGQQFRADLMKTENQLPKDHNERTKRMLLSFDGLSIGDGFGECFFTSLDTIERRLEFRDPPPPPWFFTDDTMMALSIVRCLKR